MQIKIDITEDDLRVDCSDNLRVFEESGAGRSLLRTLEDAERFMQKHSNGIKPQEMVYISKLSCKEPEKALTMLYSLGFLRGYGFARGIFLEKGDGMQAPELHG